jgi:hypothetical protein
VLTLARVRGLAWMTWLCEGAAFSNKLELLKWLQESGCPWEERLVCRSAVRGGHVNLLQWLQRKTSAWSNVLKAELLRLACWSDQLGVAQWLRQRDAGWPKSFIGMRPTGGTVEFVCCSSPVLVKWALASGCFWGNWRCQELSVVLYTEKKFKKRAAELLTFAHQHGCPCTCDAAA